MKGAITSKTFNNLENGRRKKCYFSNGLLCTLMLFYNYMHQTQTVVLTSRCEGWGNVTSFFLLVFCFLALFTVFRFTTFTFDCEAIITQLLDPYLNEKAYTHVLPEVYTSLSSLISLTGWLNFMVNFACVKDSYILCIPWFLTDFIKECFFFAYLKGNWAGIKFQFMLLSLWIIIS